MASPSPTDNSGTTNGFQTPPSTWGEFNIQSFVILQWLSKLQTATLVQVQACTNSGDLSPVGFVDVLPLVNQIDGQGEATPHETIFNIPYFRLQGGTNAIIMDPKPGDIGLCCFASRDISKVKSTKAQANPGSFREFSFSDGMYVGGLLNVLPSQYIQFNDDGIAVVSPMKVTIDTPLTVVTGIFEVQNENGESTGSSLNGGFIVTGGDVVADGISLKTHVHSGVMGGGSDTGPPV